MMFANFVLAAAPNVLEQVSDGISSGLSLWGSVVLFGWILFIFFVVAVVLILLGAMGFSFGTAFLAVFLSRVTQGNHGAKEVNGRFIEVVPPGFYLLIPPIRNRIRIIDTKIMTLPFKDRCVTADNVFVTIAGNLQVRVCRGGGEGTKDFYENIRRALYEVDSWHKTMISWFCDLLRSETIKLTLTEAFAQRDQIKEHIKLHIGENLAMIGFEILNVQILEFGLSSEVERQLEAIKIAELKQREATNLASAYTIQVEAEANADATAQAARGKGRGDEIENKAKGLLAGLRELTGNPELTLAPAGAALLLLETQRQDVMEAIGRNGRTNAMIVSSDCGVNEELVKVGSAILTADGIQTGDEQALGASSVNAESLAEAGQVAVATGNQIARKAASRIDQAKELLNKPGVKAVIKQVTGVEIPPSSSADRVV